MSSLDMAMQRIAMLEARVATLEGARVPVVDRPSGGSSAMDVEPLSDDLLHRPWADKVAKKDPPKWSGRSYVGISYSQIESAWHKNNAGFCAWKAAKGRTKVPVECNREGKPWHENDTFEARLCLAWARRNAGGVVAPVEKSAADYGYETANPAPKAVTGDYSYGEPMLANFDDGIPF